MVDDMPYCLNTLKSLIEPHLDFAVRCDQVDSGEEAIMAVRASHKLGLRYKLIITDLCMPMMSGFEAMIKIKSIMKEEFDYSPAEIPTILGLSGHIGEDYLK